MFKKIFEYAGPYKKNMYVATVVVLVSLLMAVSYTHLTLPTTPYV